MVFSNNYRNFAVVIEIERHIEILLLDNDCVIVPGLGGFTAHHVEARYDAQEGVFLPPLRTLGFNAQLKLNDSLLAQSYVEACDISYPEALRRIEAEVEELRQRLETDGYYEMTDIGTLTLNDDGNMEFTPCEAGILTPTLYGLSSFEISELEEDNAEDTEHSRLKHALPRQAVDRLKPITTTVFDHSSPNKDQNREDETDNDASENVDEPEKTICIKVAWIRNAGIAMAAAIALLLVLVPMTHTGIRNVNIGDLNSTSFFSRLIPKDSQMNTIDIKRAKVKVEDTVKVKPLAEDTTLLAMKDSAAIDNTEAKDGYGIVLASCIPKKNADSYVEQLHKQGLTEAYTYINNNKVVRVIYGHYPTENDAYNELQKIRSNEQFKESWIMELRK